MQRKRTTKARKRLFNAFGFGSPELGRLGLGPPDERQQIDTSGFPVGWHKPVDETELAPVVSLTNRRVRRTHVRGVARLAKLPRQIEEPAVGAGGGIVLPMAIAGQEPKTPFVSIATGDFHSLAIRSDGRTFGWGQGADGQLGTAPILAAIRQAEADALAQQTRIVSSGRLVAPKNRDDVLISLTTHRLTPHQDRPAKR